MNIKNLSQNQRECLPRPARIGLPGGFGIGSKTGTSLRPTYRRKSVRIRPIKILHLFGQFSCGGAEKRTLDILRHLDPRQFRFHICSLSGCLGGLESEAEAFDCKVHLLAMKRFGFQRRFLDLLRREQFDVVHSHVFLSSGYLLKLAARHGTPIRVAHFRNSHDGRGTSLPRRLYRRVMRHWIDQYATDILAVSEGAMAGVWGPYWQADPRCRVIYNGLDLAPFDLPADRSGVRHEFHLDDASLLILHVGRFSTSKNHLRLVEIFAKLAASRPEARLLLVGRTDGSIRTLIQKRVDQLVIRDKVVFCGERQDVPRLLMAADAMLFPSLWEGLPGAVLESAAAGIPVLGSNLPSIREIAARLPGVRSLPLEADDTQWVDTLLSMLDKRQDPEIRTLVREAFAQSPFTVERCTDALRNIWQSDVSETFLGETVDG